MSVPLTNIWHLLPDERSRKAVEVAARYADGQATREELNAAYDAAFDVGAALVESSIADRETLRAAAWAAAEAVHPDECAEGVALEAAEAVGMEHERQAQADLLRCLFHNPFRCIVLALDWLSWNHGLLRQLAQAIYDERHLPEGPFDPGRLAILADALEEAGCANQDILGHFRGPGPHVRGCWPLDLLLGKE